MCFIETEIVIRLEAKEADAGLFIRRLVDIKHNEIQN